MTLMNIIRLAANNDINGNPRRVYVGLDKASNIVGIWNEGYAGWGAVPTKYQRQAQGAMTFATTPAQYRSLVKRQWDTERMMKGGTKGRAANPVKRRKRTTKKSATHRSELEGFVRRGDAVALSLNFRGLLEAPQIVQLHDGTYVARKSSGWLFGKNGSSGHERSPLKR